MQWTLIPKRISVSLIVMLLQLFLFVSADRIYGSYATTAKGILIAYMLMTAVVIAITGFRPETIKGGKDFKWFFIFFLVTSFILVLIPLTFESEKLKIGALWGLGLIQAFVVSYTEETVFRGILPNFLGDIHSNLLFGVFHWAISGSIVFIFVAFGAGLCFAFIRDRWSIWASMGVHSAWNLKMLGLLDPLIKGVI